MKAFFKKRGKPFSCIPFLCAAILFFVSVACMNTPPVYAENAGTDEETSTEEYIVTTEYPDEPGREPDLVSNSAIVMDAKTGQILYQKDAYARKYPASITKIMTCLLALENCKMDETLTMSYDAIWGIDRGSNHIALDVDEQISMESGLYALMLESANEVAWAIGEHVAGGSIEDFADMMNARANELGCMDTHFTNANGLPDDHHYTTCYDMALITRAALQYKAFHTITSTINYTVPPTNLCDEERPLWHHCKMIQPGSTYYYEYCEGGKTGYTTAAKNTLVTWCKKDDLELICVVMDCSGGSATYTDSLALYHYCYANFERTTAFSDYVFTETDIAQARAAIDQCYGTVSETEIALHIDTDDFLDQNKYWEERLLTTDIQYNTDIPYDETTDTYQVGKLVYSYDGNALISFDITATGYTPSAVSDQNTEAAKETASPTQKPEKRQNGIWKLLIPVMILIILVILFIILKIRVDHQRKLQRLRSAARRQALEKQRTSELETDEL